MAKESDLQVIAFYLPQYYPNDFNNEWYGPGFTEWTNVGKARPLFKGHYQPKVPADLGYYDLRLPQVREQQAALAKEAGVSAFCYYHYWFGNGKQMLEMPLQEVVKSKSPDFPFCICWANHSWFKKTWDSNSNILNSVPIMKQEYPGMRDIDEHFYSLLDTFKDSRYYKIDGKLVFVVYHIDEIPNPKEFIDRWQELSQIEGIPGFYFMAYTDDAARISHPAFTLCNKIIVCSKYDIQSVGKSRQMRKFSTYFRTAVSKFIRKNLNKFNYEKIRSKLALSKYSEENIVPVLLPNWDNTPRRENGALILYNTTPEQFLYHCKDVFNLISKKQNRVVFLKSWNEWGEGNYMEPCIKYGHGYLHSLSNAIKEYENG